MPDFEELGEFLTPAQFKEGVETGHIEESLPLTTAASLTEEISEPADLGFDLRGYRGFQIVPPGQLPEGLPAVHFALKDRFYVASPRGSVGLVPWPGSVVVWPWEAAWAQDLHRVEVHTALRPEPKRK